MKKRYKLIENIGYKNENIIYFDRLTLKKIEHLKQLYSYVLLWYSDKLKYYVSFDFKCTEYDKALFYNNINEYCERY